MSERFRAHMRLRHSKEFEEVFRRSQRSTDKWVTVLARRNGKDSARLGLAISKKCARKAVDRNRIKRMVRESFRHNIECLRGLDLVIVGRKRPEKGDLCVFTQSLRHHWRVLSERCRKC